MEITSRDLEETNGIKAVSDGIELDFHQLAHLDTCNRPVTCRSSNHVTCNKPILDLSMVLEYI